MGVMKHDLGEGIMSEFITLRPRSMPIRLDNQNERNVKELRNVWSRKR